MNPSIPVLALGVMLAGASGSAYSSTSSTSLPPVVSTISPDHAPNSGVSGIVITGANFTGATQVLFGANAASFTIDNDSQITASSSAVSTAGWVDVSVTNPFGTGTLARGFDYFVPPEVIVPSPGIFSCPRRPITWSGSPTLGQNYTVTVPFFVVRGRLLVSWTNRLHVIGGTWQGNGCLVWINFAPDYQVAFAGSAFSYTFAIPNDMSLIGVHLKTQAVGEVDPHFGCIPSCVFSSRVLDAVIGE